MQRAVSISPEMHVEYRWEVGGDEGQGLALVGVPAPLASPVPTPPGPLTPSLPPAVQPVL